MTDSQPSPNVQFSAFLSRFPAEIVALVKRCLPKLRRDFPVSYEIVYNYANSVVVSFSMSERGYEAIAALAISPRDVRLYFDKSLPDPEGLLEGSGSKVRSVVIKAAADLDRADFQALMKAAIRHAGVTFPRKAPRSTQLIIKSDSKKKAKKKPSPQTSKKA